MAEIILGIATSRGPMMCMPPEAWVHRVEGDKRNPNLYFRGKPYRYDEIYTLRHSEDIARQASLEVRQERHAACQRALAAVTSTLVEAAPDVVVLIGDDQREAFGDDFQPALHIHVGETIDNAPIPAEHLSNRGPGLIEADWAFYPAERTSHPCDPQLGWYLVGQVTQAGFDVSYSRTLPAGCFGNHAVPHAMGFYYQRLMPDHPIPTVPVFVNDAQAPNQPTVERCYAFGTALGRAVRSWEHDARVAVVATGGLSHFVIEEDLDRQLLAAVESNDEAAIHTIPNSHLESGTAEGRNWIVAAGAMLATNLRYELLDYVPMYRSDAGTGGASAFAIWK